MKEKEKKELSEEVNKVDQMAQIGRELESLIEVRPKIGNIVVKDVDGSDTYIYRLDEDVQIKVVDLMMEDLKSQYNKIKESLNK